jgi:hypothetical protein
MRWLENISADAVRCAFVTAPDVLCDARETLKLSRPMFPRIRQLGFPAALVAQNGLEDMACSWDEFDVLFLGGDTAWKLGPAAASLSRQAIRLGKRVHVGRVNGLRRLRHAQAIGATSVDGNMIAHARRRTCRVC